MAEQGKVTAQPTPLQMETQLLGAFPQYQKQLNELLPIIKATTGQYYVESLKALNGILAQKDKFSSDVFTVLKTMVPVSKDAVRFLEDLNSIFNNPNIKKIDTPAINRLNEIIRLTSGKSEKDTEVAQFSIDDTFKDNKFTLDHFNFFYNTLTSTTKKIDNNSIKYLWNLVAGIEEFDTILVRNIFDHAIKRSGDLDAYLHAFVILGRRMPDESKIDDRYIERYCELVEYALTNAGKASIYPVFSFFLNKRINPTNLDQTTKTIFREICHFVEEVQRKSGGDAGIELAYIISKFDPKDIIKIPKQFKENTKYAIKMIYSLIRADKSLADAISEVSKIIASKHSQLVMNLWLTISSSKKGSPADIDHLIEFANALPDKLEQKVMDAIFKIANTHIASDSFNISDIGKNYGTYLYTIARLVYKEKPNADLAIFDLIGVVLQDSNLYRLDANLLSRLYSLLPKLTKDNKTEIIAILGNSKLLEAKIDLLLKILERKDAKKLLLAFRKLTTSVNFEESVLSLIEKGLDKKKLSEYLNLLLVVVDRKDAKEVVDKYGQLEKILAGFKIDKPEPEHYIYLYYMLKAVPEYEKFLKDLFNKLNANSENKKDALDYLFLIFATQKPDRQFLQDILKSVEMRGIDTLGHLAKIGYLEADKLTQFIEPAKKLVSKLKMDTNEIVTILNFAYALKIFGGDEAKVTLLYRELGIKYFLRYSEKAIVKTYERWTRGIANPAYSYIAYKDYNGALYQFRGQIDKLSEAYDFIITEGRFDYGYFEMAEKISQKAKGKPIMVSFVSGHGLPGSVDFGGSDYDEHTLDLSDIRRVKKTRAFDRNTIFIFFSCLTGAKVDGSKEVISQMVSRAKEAVAIAPRLSMYQGEIIISRGRVEKVIYSYTNPEDGTEIKEEGQVFVRGIRTNRVP